MNEPDIERVDLDQTILEVAGPLESRTIGLRRIIEDTMRTGVIRYQGGPSTRLIKTAIRSALHLTNGDITPEIEIVQETTQNGTRICDVLLTISDCPNVPSTNSYAPSPVLITSLMQAHPANHTAPLRAPDEILGIMTVGLPSLYKQITYVGYSVSVLLETLLPVNLSARYAIEAERNSRPWIRTSADTTLAIAAQIADLELKNLSVGSLTSLIGMLRIVASSRCADLFLTRLPINMAAEGNHRTEAALRFVQWTNTEICNEYPQQVLSPLTKDMEAWDFCDHVRDTLSELAEKMEASAPRTSETRWEILAEPWHAHHQGKSR